MGKMDRYFGENGVFAERKPGFIPREPQIQMAEAVNQVIENGGLLICEAGTGTGKSYAALVPTLLNEKRVVIATSGIALQEQYLNKDVPDVKHILDKEDIKVTVLKGRANYLCPFKIQYDYKYLPAHLKRIVKTLTSGDKSDLAEQLTDQEWMRLSAVFPDECLGKECTFLDKCPYLRQRKAVLSSQVVIVNYHILLTDYFFLGNQMLGEFDALIADEAHNIPDITRSFLKTAISSRRLARIRNKIADKDGDTDKIDYLIELFEQYMSGFEISDDPVFLTQGEISQPSEEFWITIEDMILFYEDANESIYKLLNKFQRDLEMFLDPESDQRSRTVEEQTLVIRPIDVSEQISSVLNQIPSVVLMSATLSTSSGFRFIAREMGLENYESLALDTIFNYDDQVLFFVPEFYEMPDPKNRDSFMAMAAQKVGNMVELMDGRTMGLFTSNQALMIAADEVKRRLPHIHLYVQGDLSSQEMAQRFRIDTQSVLLGTRTFFEGIDIPGESLSCLILDRFPFPPLNDPVVQAQQRVKTKSDFWFWYFNTAVITFKQAFGRLIRTVNDRGVFIVLDPRVKREARYWNEITKSFRHEFQIATFDEVYDFAMQLKGEEIGNGN